MPLPPSLPLRRSRLTLTKSGDSEIFTHYLAAVATRAIRARTCFYFCNLRCNSRYVVLASWKERHACVNLEMSSDDGGFLSCWALLEMFLMASSRGPAGILLTFVHGKRLAWGFRTRTALKFACIRAFTLKYAGSVMVAALYLLPIA